MSAIPATANCSAQIIAKHQIDAIIHFAASVVVPDSVANPLGYYRNNTVNSRTLIEAAVKGGVKHFIFSSTAAVYGNPQTVPVAEDAPTIPISPYGSSKLMTEMMLRDTSAGAPFKSRDPALFQRRGRRPEIAYRAIDADGDASDQGRGADRLGLRDKLHVFGTDYPTPDGTCIRDYIHVSDLVRAHSDALRYLRGGGASLTFNCGYGHGFSVLEVIEAVKRIAGVDFPVEYAPPRAGDPAQIVADATRARRILGWQPRFDDLATIVAHALEWEQKLKQHKPLKTKACVKA